MTTLILTITLILIAAPFDWGTRATMDTNLQDKAVTLVTLTQPGMPVQLDRVSVENLTGSSWLKYSATNISAEPIREIDLRIFSIDRKTNLLGLTEASSHGQIPANSTSKNRLFLSESFDPQKITLIAVVRAVGESGVWIADKQAFEDLSHGTVFPQPELISPAKYESHLVLSAEDDRQILTMLVEDVVKNKQNRKQLSPGSRIIFAKERGNLGPLNLAGANISVLDPDEIQEIANREGSVRFFSYQPPTVEGSRVITTLVLKEEVARPGGIGIPYRYVFRYILTKHNGRWAIEKSLSYSWAPPRRAGLHELGERLAQEFAKQKNPQNMRVFGHFHKTL